MPEDIRSRYSYSTASSSSCLRILTGFRVHPVRNSLRLLLRSPWCSCFQAALSQDCAGRSFIRIFHVFVRFIRHTAVYIPPMIKGKIKVAKRYISAVDPASPFPARTPNKIINTNSVEPIPAGVGITAASITESVVTPRTCIGAAWLISLPFIIT